MDAKSPAAGVIAFPSRKNPPTKAAPRGSTFAQLGALGNGMSSASRAAKPIEIPSSSAGLWGAERTGVAGAGGFRTSAWRNQNPLPYRLATPQRAARLVRPGGKRPDNSSGLCPSQWPRGRFCLKGVMERRGGQLGFKRAPPNRRWRRRRECRPAHPVPADRRRSRGRRRPPRRRAQRQPTRRPRVGAGPR